MTNNLNKPLTPVQGGNNMRWIVTNHINKTKRTFENKAEALAYCKQKAFNFEKSEKYLEHHFKVGHEQRIATAASEDGQHRFQMSVRLTVNKKDGTPDKWKVLIN